MLIGDASGRHIWFSNDVVTSNWIQMKYGVSFHKQDAGYDCMNKIKTKSILLIQYTCRLKTAKMLLGLKYYSL